MDSTELEFEILSSVFSWRWSEFHPSESFKLYILMDFIVYWGIHFLWWIYPIEKHFTNKSPLCFEKVTFLTLIIHLKLYMYLCRMWDKLYWKAIQGYWKVWHSTLLLGLKMFYLKTNPWETKNHKALFWRQLQSFVCLFLCSLFFLHVNDTWKVRK